MLSTVFLFCAIIGGVIMVGQFLLTLIGVGDDGGSFDADPGFDLGGDGDFDIDLDGSDHASHLFEVLSLQTMVTGITAFGLVGYIANGSGQTNLVAILAASAAGVAAIYGMYYLMRSLHRLQEDGTVKITSAVGSRGNVLVPIPPKSGGPGKVSVSLQGRLQEITALSDYDGKLATGVQVEVVEVLGPRTVLVAPVTEDAGAPPSDSLAQSTSSTEAES